MVQAHVSSGTRRFVVDIGVVPVRPERCCRAGGRNLFWYARHTSWSLCGGLHHMEQGRGERVWYRAAWMFELNNLGEFCEVK